MANPKPLTNADGELRELTSKDADDAVAFSQMPASEREVLQFLRERTPAQELR